uniref:RELT like 2 n=1 Tax=Zosterops lateralis melanops TaxID=1220523 RepID=A0A8D2NTI2_ZOSLA
GGAPQPGAEHQHGITVVFLLVLVFFVMGLVGFLICHVLKKKGYRCRTFRDEPQLQPDEKNDDTVEKIVRCIIQNEANVEALKEMLGENEVDVPVPVPSLCPHSSSQDGGPPHHHTVHLGSTQAPCIHCSRRKRHPLQRQGRSKEGKSRMHPGETTVFSVGRYPKETWTTKFIPFHPLQWTGTPPTVPSCSKPQCPAWPWALACPPCQGTIPAQSPIQPCPLAVGSHSLCPLMWIFPPPRAGPSAARLSGAFWGAGGAGRPARLPQAELQLRSHLVGTASSWLPPCPWLSLEVVPGKPGLCTVLYSPLIHSLAGAQLHPLLHVLCPCSSQSPLTHLGVLDKMVSSPKGTFPQFLFCFLNPVNIPHQPSPQGSHPISPRLYFQS